MNKLDVLVINHVDPDGFCAGAIVKYHEQQVNPHRKIECYGMNHGYDMPWSRIKRAKKIYIVDFSFPVSDMLKVIEIVGRDNVIWIDHHKTVIEDYDKAGLSNLQGLREIGKAGCELTWIYFNFNKPMPTGVKVIGRYDVWDIKYSDPEAGIFSHNIFPFIQAIKYHEARADEDLFWFKLFESDSFYFELLKEGELLYKYQQKMNARYAKSHSFEFEWEGLRFIALNALNCNSQIFDEVFDHNKHDAVLAYGYTNRNWSVSMYTAKQEVDVSALAHKYGGGGHANACGFHCINLPFEHLLDWKDE